MPRLTIPVTDDDHILGETEDATYTLVEYGDLQCPDTAIAEPELQDVLLEMEGQIRFVYRHFPLNDIHIHAQMAAEALEAAGAQGKFWEMRQLLLENQHHLEYESLLEHARELKLDLERFKRELDDHTHAKRIEEDMKGGVRSGVEATPTFFLNRDMLDPGISLYDVFEDLAEEEDEESEE